MLRILILTGLFISATGAASAQSRMSRFVAATGGRRCMAYLHTSGDSKKHPLIVNLAGTGIYSMGDLSEMNPVAGFLVRKEKAVVLSIDKPGIVYAKNAPKHFRIDDAVYNQHTQRDLVECVIHAIDWASATGRTHPSGDIYFLTHSEGTQISVRVLKKLLDERKGKVVARIKGLFLTGLVMQSAKKIINSQITDPVRNAKFWRAIQRQDDTVLRSITDVAFAYWKDILSTEPNEKTLKELAVRGVKVPLQIYQGLQDKNTTAQPVLAFEAWNRRRLRERLPALRLQARYYQADHSLNLAAVDDMIFAFLAYLEP